MGSQPEVTTAMPRQLVPECNIESGTVSTYDGKNLEMNLCNHILAQDKFNKDWVLAGEGNVSQCSWADWFVALQFQE